VCLDLDEFATHPRLVGELLKAFARTLAANLIGMIKEVLDRPILLDQFCCSLLADARYSRDVIRAVTPKRLDVNELPWFDAPPVAKRFHRHGIKILAPIGRSENGYLLG